jgi:hypothetical protein
MASRLALAVLGAFSISLLAMGAGQAAVCDPHCSPSQSNKGGEVRGLNRANEVAGEHGQYGRDNAAAKQDLHKPGGSGVDSGGSTGGTTGGTTDGGGTTGGTTGGGTTPGPCTGC